MSNQSIGIAADFFNGLTRTGTTDLIIGINISAGSPTRVWQLAKFIALIHSIMDSRPNAQIILFCIPDERDKAAEISANFDNKISIIPGGLDLEGVSAFISNLEVLITPDTSLVHIARSFNVQVVGLYTRFMKNFLLWKPFGQKSGTVVSDNDDNIHGITPQQVYAEFIKVAEFKQAVVQ